MDHQVSTVVVPVDQCVEWVDAVHLIFAPQSEILIHVPLLHQEVGVALLARVLRVVPRVVLVDARRVLMVVMLSSLLVVVEINQMVVIAVAREAVQDPLGMVVQQMPAMAVEVVVDTLEAVVQPTQQVVAVLVCCPRVRLVPVEVGMVPVWSLLLLPRTPLVSRLVNPLVSPLVIQAVSLVDNPVVCLHLNHQVSLPGSLVVYQPGNPALDLQLFPVDNPPHDQVDSLRVSLLVVLRVNPLPNRRSSPAGSHQVNPHINLLRDPALCLPCNPPHTLQYNPHSSQVASLPVSRVGDHQFSPLVIPAVNHLVYLQFSLPLILQSNPLVIHRASRLSNRLANLQRSHFSTRHLSRRANPQSNQVQDLADSHQAYRRYSLLDTHPSSP